MLLGMSSAAGHNDKQDGWPTVSLSHQPILGFEMRYGDLEV
jgi:hypothetical protein